MTISVGDRFRLHNNEFESDWNDATVEVTAVLSKNSDFFANALDTDLYEFEVVDKENYPPFDADVDIDESSPYKGLAFAGELFPLEA